MLNRSAIILAGGRSSRFGQDKGLFLLADKPLLQHVLRAVDGIVDEKFVVVSSESQLGRYSEVTDSSIDILVDKATMRGPLVGALTGFEKARGEHSILLPCDTPLVSRNILAFLFESCKGRKAAIPLWPNGYIEPLQAVYHTRTALKAAKEAALEGKLDLQSMITRMCSVWYVSTRRLTQLDRNLNTFLNINRLSDLKRAETLFGCARCPWSQGK